MNSFEEDIQEMKEQVTQEVIFHINSSPSLYSKMKDLDAKGLKQAVYEHAGKNDNWFGQVFEPELDVVDWELVKRSV